MAVQIQIRRDTASNWTSVNPTLAQGEIGVETDTDKAKIGNGADDWTTLPYWVDPGAGGAVDSVNGQTGTVSLALEDLDDVDAAAPTDGYALTWNNSAGKWEPAAPSGGMSNPMTTAGDIIIGGTSGAPQRLAAGTDTYVLTMVSGAPAWAAAGGGGGLSGFTASNNTASPNNTVNAARLIVNSTSTNADAVFQPKGTGAVLAQLPDNAATGGNKRGASAVDLQSSRNSAAQVASGTSAVVVGGRRNTAGGAYSVVVGGDTNTASVSTATVVGGQGNTASAADATVGGGAINTASGSAATVSGGASNAMSGRRSACPGGGYATDRGVGGRQVYSSGAMGNTQGAIQIGTANWGNITATATPADLNDGSTSSVMTMANNSTMAFTVMVVGRTSTAGGNRKFVELKGMLSRGANAAATAIDGTVDKVVVEETGGATTWDANVVADTATGGMKVQVTGAASTSINWSAKIDTVEIVL